MSRDNMELVSHFYELALQKNWDQLDLLAHDVVYRPIAEITETGEYHGRAAFRRYMEKFLDEDWADDLAYTTSCREYGDKVIARIQFEGHGRASGLDFTARVFAVHTVRNGEIVRVEDFTDRREALAAAGVYDIVDRVREGYELWNSGDLDAWLDLVDPDVETVFYAGPDASTYRGHEGVREWYREGLEAWDGWGRIEPEEVVDLGDRVLTIGRWRVRGKGSGLEVESRQAHLITLRDGLVTRLEFYEDEDRARAAAGLI